MTHEKLDSSRYGQFLPPLSTEEREGLERSIGEHGVQVPIVIDEGGVILDGRHRYAIAGDEAPTTVLKGLTGAEKEAYVFQCNFARRNLSPNQKKAILREMKKVAKALRDDDAKKNTQKRVADLLGVARETVRDWFMPNGGAANTDNPPPDARIKINPKHHPVILDRYESGESQSQIAADYGVDQSQISRMATVEKRVRAVKAERIEAIRQIGSDAMGVRCGDLREIGHTVEDDSVDLIFTDPVYHKDSVHLYGELAKFAARVLRPGGGVWRIAVIRSCSTLPTSCANTLPMNGCSPWIIAAVMFASEGSNFWSSRNRSGASANRRYRHGGIGVPPPCLAGEPRIITNGSSR